MYLEEVKRTLAFVKSGDIKSAITVCETHPDVSDLSYIKAKLTSGVSVLGPKELTISALLNWSRSHHLSERRALARIGYTTALAFDPSNKDCLSDLGVLYLDEKDYSRSLTALTRAADLICPGISGNELRHADKELEIRLGILAATVLKQLAGMVSTSADITMVFQRLATPFRHSNGFYTDLAIIAGGSAVKKVKELKLKEATLLGLQAACLMPDAWGIYFNIGLSLEQSGYYEDAEKYYLRSEKTAKDISEKSYAKIVLMHLYFRVGQWERFAELLPHKYKHSPLAWWKDAHSIPLWDGSIRPGTSILIYGESGFGDVIQCIRYAKFLHMHGMTVHVVCQKRLVPLCRLVDGVASVRTVGEPVPETDWRVQSFDLFYILERNHNVVFGSAGYIDLSKSKKLESVLERKPGEMVVGIKWTTTDPSRDLPLSSFSRFSELPGVRFISLQPEPPPSDLPFKVEEPLKGVFDAEDSFLITAHLINELDLVITADSVIAHLAGAIGVETWVFLTAVHECRWMIDRSDSPFYDSVTLFRQRHGAADWSEIMDKVEQEIRRRQSHRQDARNPT